MPDLFHRSDQFCNGSPITVAVGSPGGIWSKRRDEITFDRLQKFWSELPLEARQILLRINKQTLFEQARKNLYCSRCNGMLLEGFSQIVMYGKSLQQQEGTIMESQNGAWPYKSQNNREWNDIQEMLVQPWGGLATTRDGILTLLDCLISANSLEQLQNVFDNARARERERELLYPDACGGEGRGWISQGIANYGRGHGTRESCALHTAKLSCDTLVDFWAALSDDTRSSLLRMKEEDFIERLMYRFDSKRFCRDCRRNVIREFKELKELKRMRRETRCSSWFCVADTAFQYEVLEDTVHADWHQSFADTVGTYHHFEWAIGTGEGKSDILDFEDVGMNGKVQINGLDLGGLSACFITLRAYKLDGRYAELRVKAHALKGQPCVHRRLIVGDGFVTITKGESIERFFEHAEEAEEDEDDDAMDKDGNEFDSDGARPQKHAKSPELAREFLLDAATVIFKEQVEKAFREGTARQNAHSIFVCLALKLLEERIHVACKEIITLEKQTKLLEEEERDKREEEERKEMKKTKEREKKLRRKERLKEKERDREGPNSLQFPLLTSNNHSSSSANDDSPNTPDSGDSASDQGDVSMSASPTSPDTHSTSEQFNACVDADNLENVSLWHERPVEEDINSRDDSGDSVLEQSKSTRKKLRFKKGSILDQASKRYGKCHSLISDANNAQYDESDRKLTGCIPDPSRCINGAHRPSRERFVWASARACTLKFGDKFRGSSSRVRDRYNFQSCSCDQQGERRAMDGYQSSTIKSGREKLENNTSPHKTDYSMDIGRPSLRGPKYRDVHKKQVWEPLDARKKHTGSYNDHDITKSSSIKPHISPDVGFDKDEDVCEQPQTEFSSGSSEPNALTSDLGIKDSKHNPSSAAEPKPNSPIVSASPTRNGSEPITNSSNSDNCSSCLSSEMDNSSSSSLSSTKNSGSSSTSDSENTIHQSNSRYISSCDRNSCHTLQDNTSGAKTNVEVPAEGPANLVNSLPLHNQSFHVPFFPSPDMRYHNQAVGSWSAAPTSAPLLLPPPNHYMVPTIFGYSVPPSRPSDFHIQYSTLQPLAPPVLSVGYPPFYDPTDRIYPATASSKERIMDLNASGTHLINDAAKAIEPSKPPSRAENGNVGGAAKPSEAVPFFSLFHFGGPVAGPSGFVENTGRSLSDFPASISCSKEETAVEEYSLFSANNSALFSFF